MKTFITNLRFNRPSSTADFESSRPIRRGTSSGSGAPNSRFIATTVCFHDPSSKQSDGESALLQNEEWTASNLEDSYGVGVEDPAFTWEC
jgi:hypothetical protein